MRDFFHGWRRKAGCATLAVALVVLAAWMRTRLHEDRFRCTFTRHNAAAIHVVGGCLAFAWEWQDRKGARQMRDDGVVMYSLLFDPDQIFSWETYPAGDSFGEAWGSLKMSRRYWVWGKFRAGDYVNQTIGFRMIQIPCLTIVFVLTMLSAHLILWKPGKRLA